jgi:hypothetical protein
MKISQSQKDFLDGWLSEMDGLSDGAWQAVCQDLIEQCGQFKGKDSYDVWMAWLNFKRTSK